MVDKINVEIPLDLARKFVSWQRDGSTTELEELVKAALPLEYPDGTYAWVTGPGIYRPVLVHRENGMWVRAKGGSCYIFDADVTEVEVLPLAGEGEIVVPKPNVYPEALQCAANVLDRGFYFRSADFLRNVADRL